VVRLASSRLPLPTTLALSSLILQHYSLPLVTLFILFLYSIFSFYFSVLLLHCTGYSVGSSIIPGRDVSPFASVRTVPVFIVEDLRIPSIIPPEPELPILIEDDDDPPVSFGFEESEELRRKLWIDRRPHRVYEGDVRGAGAEGGMGERKNEAGDGGRDSEREGDGAGEWRTEGGRKGLNQQEDRGRGENEREKEGGREAEGVYSSVAAALSEAFSIASGRFTRKRNSGSDRALRGEKQHGNGP
jgi:hypothetical protein